MDSLTDKYLQPADFVHQVTATTTEEPIYDTQRGGIQAESPVSSQGAYRQSGRLPYQAPASSQPGHTVQRSSDFILDCNAGIAAILVGSR